MKARLLKAGIISLEIFGAVVAVLVLLLGYALWRVEHKGLSLNRFNGMAAHIAAQKLPPGYQFQLDQVHLRVSPEDRRLYQIEMRDVVVANGIDKKAATHPDLPSSIPLSLPPFGPFISARVPKIIIEVPKDQILKGRFGVQNLIANNVIIEVDQQVLEKSDVTSSNNDQRLVDRFSELLDSDMYRDIFRSVIMEDVHVIYKSVETQKGWQADNIDVRFEKSTGADFAIKANADFLYADKKSGMLLQAAYDEQKDRIQLFLDGQNMPLGDISSIFFGMTASPITAPISGQGRAEFTSRGALLDVGFDLEAGAGKLSVAALGNDPLDIKTLKAVGGYDPQAKALKLEVFDVFVGKNKALISGLIKLETVQIDHSTDEAGKIGDNASGGRSRSQNGIDVFKNTVIDFDLEVQKLTLDREGLFQKTLELDRAKLIGQYDINGRQLSLSDIDLNSDDIKVGGRFALHIPPKDDIAIKPPFGLQADLKIDGRVGYQKLMDFWPLSLAPISRTWVKNRVRRGYAKNITFQADLKPGLRGKLGYTPNKDLKLEFDVADVSVDYIYGLPLLTKSAGHGVVQGNSLKVTMDSGYVRNVKAKKGIVSIPQFDPPTKNIVIQFDAAGQAGEILDILNQKPLGLISRGGLDPKQISGNANVTMELQRVRGGNVPGNGLLYDGKAEFDNLTFKEIFADVDLENAKGTIDLKTRNMTIAGIAEIDQEPVNIEWVQNFYVDEDGPSKLKIEGTFDSSTADLIGLPVRSFLRGAIDYTVNAQGAYRALEKVTIDADLKEAALRFDFFGWSKRKDIPANAKLEIEFDQSGAAPVTRVNRFILKGDTLDIDGKLSFAPTGRLLGLGFRKFFIKDQADFAAEAERAPEGQLDFILSGAFLDIGPVIANYLSGRGQTTSKETVSASVSVSGDDSGSEAENIVTAADGSDKRNVDIDWGDGVRASVRIDKLKLRNDILLSDTSLDVWRDFEKLQILNLAGLDSDLDPLSITLTHGVDEEDNKERIIEAQTNDLGTLLEGLFEVSSIRGGEGILHLRYNDAKKDIVSGDVYAQNVKLVNAPILAKLFAAGSFDGLGDLVSGEGIAFDKIKTDFQIDADRLIFEKAQAVGPSIGITSNGSLRLDGNGDVNLNGAFAPAYQVNSLLGNVPLIGKLFVSRTGEGVLALSYRITGDVSAPSISVNPLSAFAPGVFRRVFEPVNEARGEEAPLPVAPPSGNDTPPPTLPN